LETTIHKRSQVLRELEIFVPEEEVKAAIDRAFHDLRPRVNLPGFRPGKAPIDVIKKLHGDAVEGDALEKLAQEKFKLAAEEHKLEPVGTPVMTDLHRHQGEGAHFRINYEVKPEISLTDYEGIEVERPILTVNEKDVDERVHYLRFNYATRSDTDRIEDLETIASLTFREVEPDETGAQPPSQSTDVYLYDPQVVEKLRNELIGRNVGDTITLDLPKQLPDGTSREIPVEITVGKLVKIELPETDEEFCKKVSRDQAKTIEEVRALVRTELEVAAKRNSQEALESNMVKALLDRHNFEVPRSITYSLIDAMIQEQRAQNKRNGYAEDYGIDVEEWRQKYWQQSEVRGKWLLLRDKIIAAEQVEATEDDIAKLAERDAEAYGVKKENLLQYYLKNAEIAERVKSEKLVDRLKEKFVIKDVEVKD
jgi:trigger factor